MPTVASTGVANLDEILGGGLLTRTMILIIGVPGTGKTIFAEQIAVHHAKQGERALIFTALSESHHQMLAGLAELSFADPALIGDRLRYYSVQSALDQGLDAVAELIIETARAERASVVVLDGFHGIAGFAEWEHQVNRFLYDLRSQLALLFVGLAESAGQLYAKAHAFGLDLRGAVERGMVSLLLASPATVDVDILATHIRRRVEEMGIRRAAIDSIAVLEQEVPFPKRAPRYVSSLLDYLREHGVTTILIHESGALDSGRVADALPALLSDNLVIPRWVEYRGRQYRIVSVQKMRQSAFDPGLREFRIADGQVRVLPLAESGIETMDSIVAQEERERRIARRNRPE